MAAFHGLDDDGSVLSIRIGLRKGRMADVWMAWQDEVRVNRMRRAVHQVWITLHNLLLHRPHNKRKQFYH